jgi:uncharacterized protein YpbB
MCNNSVLDEKYNNIINNQDNQDISTINNIIITNDNLINIKKESTDKITFNLFLEGKSVEDLSIIRKLSINTIENHIISNLPCEQFDINKIISKDEYEEIDNELKKYNYDTLLRPIKENISKNISYFKIKIVYKINKNNI